MENRRCCCCCQCNSCTFLFTSLYLSNCYCRCWWWLMLLLRLWYSCRCCWGISNKVEHFYEYVTNYNSFIIFTFRQVFFSNYFNVEKIISRKYLSNLLKLICYPLHFPNSALCVCVIFNICIDEKKCVSLSTFSLSEIESRLWGLVPCFDSIL